jgi:hypothetical protein
MALQKIGGHAHGARLQSAHAKEVSHLFFADGVKRAFSSMFATHPDLPTRIRSIDASWGGQYPSVKIPEGGLTSPLPGAEAAGVSPLASPLAAVPGDVFEVTVDPQAMVESVGVVRPEHVAQASSLVATLPAVLAEAAHEPYGARALVYLLLLDPDEELRAAQTARLTENADPAVLTELQRLLGAGVDVKPLQRLPLLELSLQSLRHLSGRQYDAFVQNMEFLILADQRVSVFEFVLRRLVLRQYDLAAGRSRPAGSKGRSLSSVLPQTVTLMSALAWYGADGDKARANAAFAAGSEHLRPRQKRLAPADYAGLSSASLDAAIEQIRQAKPMARKWIVDASVAVIAHDRTVTVEEAELLRAIGSALESPIPVLTPGQTA